GLAAGSPVAAVAGAGRAVTAMRVEGFPASVAARTAELKRLLAPSGEIAELGREDSLALWRALRDVTPFADDRARCLWRLSLPPATSPAVVARIAARLEVRAFYDWGGGLVWLETPAAADGGAGVVRAAIGPGGGQATLVRAPEPLRAAVPVFEPLADALAALSRRVKAGFDPRGVLNPGRLYAGS
ncbi:MAG TPA: 2-hydroxy-acid oxidase, partial [Stellaceae bacterium]|nr:2-hydroxy-acid oxidase [Stellaceae bacterium]